MFHVGMHVLCIDDRDRRTGDPYEWKRAGLRRGVVYTVRGFGENFVSATPAILLVEIKRAHYGNGEPGFAVWRFRPLSSDRLSIFRQHLAPLSTDKVEA